MAEYGDRPGPSRGLLSASVYLYAWHDGRAGGVEFLARDAGQGRYRTRPGREPLMEAEALTTDTWSMQDAPENASAVPDTLNDNREQPDRTERTFRDLRVAEPICPALEAAGISTAFPIQALALPTAPAGHDLLGQARPPPGKTPP